MQVVFKWRRTKENKSETFLLFYSILYTEISLFVDVNNLFLFQIVIFKSQIIFAAGNFYLCFFFTDLGPLKCRTFIFKPQLFIS